MTGWIKKGKIVPRRSLQDQNIFIIREYTIKKKAKSFATSLGLKGFTASDGWLTNFKRGHNFVFKKLCGESASVDNSICAEGKD